MQRGNAVIELLCEACTLEHERYAPVVGAIKDSGGLESSSPRHQQAKPDLAKLGSIWAQRVCDREETTESERAIPHCKE